MHSAKTRIFGVVLILVSVGLVYYNWRQLWLEGSYSMKLAAFGPVCIVGGIYLILFPSMAGKPKSIKEKLVTLTVLVIGLAAGLVNWYLMDPGFFGK